MDLRTWLTRRTDEARLNNIWTAQYRHGEADGPIPDVSPRVAQAAIHDAVTLVQWFEDGCVRRVSGLRLDGARLRIAERRR